VAEVGEFSNTCEQTVILLAFVHVAGFGGFTHETADGELAII
jgi:hypothetical protein